MVLKLCISIVIKQQVNEDSAIFECAYFWEHLYLKKIHMLKKNASFKKTNRYI